MVLAGEQQIRGGKRFGNLHEEATRVLGNQVKTGYDSDEWTQGVTGADWSLRTNRPNLFKNVPIAQRVLIRADQAFTIKFVTAGMPTGASNPVITIPPSEYFEETRLEVTDVLINNANAALNIKVYLS